MPAKPQPIKNVIFGEPFFDGCIAKAGGYRLTDKHVPPSGKENVDYIVGDFAVELKILDEEPLDKKAHQEAFDRLVREEVPNGPLFVTGTKQMVRLTGATSDKLWREIVGTPMRNALKKASSQIRETNEFIGRPLRGAVLLVNNGGFSLDSRTLVKLSASYCARHPRIEAVFTFCAIPEMTTESKNPRVTFGIWTKDPKDSAAVKLGQAIDDAVHAEFERVTGTKAPVTPVDMSANEPKPVFTVTDSGKIVRKMGTFIKPDA